MLLSISDERKALKRELNQHQRNLEKVRKKAKYGLYVPLLVALYVGGGKLWRVIGNRRTQLNLNP